MKKLLIICEGQTEEAFCDKILKKHFFDLGIAIEYPLVAHSGGGIVPWRYLKREIELHYSTDCDRFITTFIDYYGMYEHQNFPQWSAAHLLTSKSLIMDSLETGMFNDISVTVQQKFIPNIVLHEFETLILSDYSVFEEYYEVSEFNAADLTTICAAPPETINNGLLSAPSKRLKNNIPAYDKVNDGSELAILIGLPTIRMKCPRFDKWIKKLEAI